jgi:hypothetical protein
MSVMLDVLGSVVIAATLLLMIMTFQMQMRETVTRLHYTGSMIEHMDEVTTTLNHTFAMAGIGIPVSDVCTIVDTNRIEFKTLWDVAGDSLSSTLHVIHIALDDSSSAQGKVLTIKQDGSVIQPLGYIMYIERIRFNYFDLADSLTTDTSEVRSAEVLLTFRRDSPWNPDQPLRSNIQMKSYFMNSYLQGG